MAAISREVSEPRAATRDRFEAGLGREFEPPVDTRDDVAASAVCACGRRFDIALGEQAFAQQHGLPLPSRCRRCRPTRREVA